MRPRRAAIYARVSADGQTTTNQIQELREAATRNGWTIVHEFVDRGISGAKDENTGPPSIHSGRGSVGKTSMWSWCGPWTDRGARSNIW